MKADWKVVWNNGKVEFFCSKCYSGLGNKHKVEDVSKCKDNRNCDKCQASEQPVCS